MIYALLINITVQNNNTLGLLLEDQSAVFTKEKMQ